MNINDLRLEFNQVCDVYSACVEKRKVQENVELLDRIGRLMQLIKEFPQGEFAQETSNMIQNLEGMCRHIVPSAKQLQHVVSDPLQKLLDERSGDDILDRIDQLKNRCLLLKSCCEESSKAIVESAEENLQEFRDQVTKELPLRSPRREAEESFNSSTSSSPSGSVIDTSSPSREASVRRTPGNSFPETREALDEEAIDAHRNISNQKASSYTEDIALDKLANDIFMDLEKENKSELDDLLKRGKIAQYAIRRAELKEAAVRQVYEEHMQERVDQGYYNPKCIPQELVRDLGPPTPIPDQIKDEEKLADLIKHEIDKVTIGHPAAQDQKHHVLNKSSSEYLRYDMEIFVKQYLEFRPGEFKNAFELARDIIRCSAYQEKYDKGSFTGSDHGCKHGHNNMQFARHIEACLGRKLSAKERFMISLIHLLHDVGYTTGLSSKNFLACKDHPFIGAKMVDDNAAYFDRLIGEDARLVLRDCILLHAIAMPDLTAREGHFIGDLNLRLMRAIISTSDACAVSYDRKTQEFWEQPKPLVALAGLKMFIGQFPEYGKKLGSRDSIDKLRGSEDPLDVFALRVFDKTLRLLHEAVDEFEDAPENIKNLFRQAIEQQFNGFTAHVTLGQYGVQLLDVGAQQNPNFEQNVEKEPEYIPQFFLAPSLMHAVLEGLEEGLGNTAVAKLLKEFYADFEKIKPDFHRHAEAVRNGEELPPSEQNCGCCHVTVMSSLRAHTHVEGKPLGRTVNFQTPALVEMPESPYPGKVGEFDGDEPVRAHLRHHQEMEEKANKAAEEIQGVYSRAFKPEDKQLVIKNLIAWRAQEGQSLPQFFKQHVTPKLEGTLVEPERLNTIADKGDLAEGIRESDMKWKNEVMGQLGPGMSKEYLGVVEAFKKELNQIRGSLPDKFGEASAKFEKEIDKITDDQSKTRLRYQLDIVKENIRVNASIYKGGETKFKALTQGIVFALMTENEYEFILGEKESINNMIVAAIHRPDV